MFRLSHPFEDIFNFQRENDLFGQLWGHVGLPAFNTPEYPVHVQSGTDAWRVEVPMPGIDPRQVSIEVAGPTVSIRAEQQGVSNDGRINYQRTISLPRFLDLERVTASHRHGLLELTVPVKDSLKPRRVPIDGVEIQQQLTA